MVTFMEWVNAVETMMKVIAEYRVEINEARRTGVPVDFGRLAKMAVQAIQATLQKDNFPEPIRQAATRLASSPELEPSVLGGKMRGRLKGVNPNDQEDVAQDAIFTYIRGLPGMMAKHPTFMTNPEIETDDLGSYIAATFHTQVGWQLQTFWRASGRRPPTVTDIAGGDDGQRPEASYEEEPETSPRGVEITPTSWNNGIKTLMSVREKVHEDITARLAARPKKTTTSQEKQIKLLDTSLALMRNMPHQMAQQLNFRDTEGQDKMSGDERIYMRLKSMIMDDTSDIDPEDRATLATWASHDKSKEYQIRQPKQVVAAALWVGSGMIGSQKPAILKGGNEKTFPEDNWFFQIINDHDIDPDEFEDDDDTELYRKPTAPARRSQEDDLE